MDRLFLIDGHALIFKMYYAFLRRPMVNSKGADMSILFGFTKYLLELIARERPTHIAVAFDPPGGTFRNKLYPQYKANRPPTPQLVIDALGPLQEIVRALNIPVLMVPGFEADDVIGSMGKRSAHRDGMTVYMVTPDKDYGQLIEKGIFQYKPGKGGGDNEVIGVPEICAKYGISSPSQVIEMLAICGDTSDNVPGVKGVGEVGASKLIAKYGSVKGIYGHIEELSPKQQAMFREAEGHMALSHELVTIKTDIPLDVTAEDMRLDTEYDPLIADLFEKYEFASLRSHIAHIRSVPKGEAATVRLSPRRVSAEEITSEARRCGRCSVIAEADGGDVFAPVTRVTVGCLTGDGAATGLSAEGKAAAAGTSLTGTVACGTADDFATLLEDVAIAKYGSDLKPQLNHLEGAGINVGGKLMDVSLMHYLLNPEKSHGISVIVKSILGIDLEGDSPAEASTGSLFDEPAATPAKDRDTEALAILLVADKIAAQMDTEAVRKLYDELEGPLIRVLSDMERTGVRVDMNSLRDFAAGLRAEMRRHEAAVRELSGEPQLNVSSPRQVGTVLFEKLGLNPKAKKGSNGSYSTDENTLSELADKHPVIGEILEYRATKKLLSTYIEPFGGYVSPVDGKVHTTFNQALTSTGRLSSSNPNLQNIPIRTDRGREIRKAFVPSLPDGVILSADYSQIELRVMAHFSCDQHMTEAFRSGEDVHLATAAKIFGIPVEAVTPEQRRVAKTANFGIMYGISAFGLAQRLKIPRNEAKQLIDGYFASFPSIQSFINDTLDGARENGYVETLFGRRRYIPDINSKNATVRALAERNAVNAPIQGTAADIIKYAMIRVAGRMKGLRSRMVLQIHDELLFDAAADEAEDLRAMVTEEMENVVKLNVPLTVECNYGKNWLEAH